MRRRTRSAKVARAAAVAALISLLALSADAHPLRWFWRYDPIYFRADHGWPDHYRLRRTHRAWHDAHPQTPLQKHREFHHELVHDHRRMHYHRQLRRQTGQASWYRANGETGACGRELRGMYAAHRRWPCGSLVSVRRGNKHIFVRIRDRGPYVDGRVIDLSRRAFRKLADPSAGVLNVTIYRLED
ncbi:MAG TPA: septal ring lytic transglycosylase RlpA family protein [Actinomycetota bacterium]|nr:septal ring lytic transglycosylase RlpA family protein [Actinomycetota bacterium]